MVLDVLKLILVQMEKNGISLHSLVNAPLEQLGMALFALNQLLVGVVNIWMKIINVFAPKTFSLKMEFAKLQAVMEGKFGMVLNVFVKLDSIGMEVSAFFVLMDNHGIQEQDLADVKKDINGMEIFARNILLVVEGEFSTENMINVYAQTKIIGTELNAYKNLNAAVAKDGMRPPSNVTVLKDLTGMGRLVWFVQLEKLGILLKKYVFVLLELNGTINFVQLLRIVEVV